MRTEKFERLDRSNRTPSDWLAGWFQVLHLKQTYRKGWLERGLSDRHCESVAEHSFGVAMLALLIGRDVPSLNLEKILRLALIHDLGEAHVGDLTPLDNVPKPEKVAREEKAVDAILALFPDSTALKADWLEYEAQETMEARFVKQLDRLEFALQGALYQESSDLDTEALIKRVGAGLTDDLVKALFAETLSP